MEKKMRIIQLLFLALILVSCETISGNFTALNELVFKDGVKVPAGVHKAKIKAKKRSLTLEFSKDLKVKFNIPKNTDLPTRNGEIILSQNDVKQPFDIQGNVATNVSDSESRRDYESCTYREPQRVCYRDNQGRTRCYTEYRDIRGYRNVQYRLRTEDKKLSISLQTPGTNILAGHFEGNDVSRFRVYEYEGICR